MPERDLPSPAAMCDGGDLDCGSGLLLIIRAAMQPLAPGEILEVRSREGSVREDLPAWCRMVGHTLVAESEADPSRSYYLRKKGADGSLDADLDTARSHVWQARVRWNGGMQAKAAVRNHGFGVGQPASFDTDDAAPSALEYLVAAVGGALTTGLSWRLSQRGISVHNLEVVVRARVRDILVFLGMNDDGDPGLERLEISIYVDADLDQEALDHCVRDTVRRCPVTQSLDPTIAVDWTAKIL